MQRIYKTKQNKMTQKEKKHAITFIYDVVYGHIDCLL